MPTDTSTGLALVVDDEVAHREATRRQLVAAGYQVELAESATAALDLLEGGLRPSLILVDLFMPRLDAVGFRRRQLAIPELAAIPTIILTANGYSGAIASSVGVPLLRKPFSVEAVREAVAAAAKSPASASASAATPGASKQTK